MDKWLAKRMSLKCAVWCSIVVGSMPKLAPSREKASCGLCPYVGRTDALLRHSRSKHEGKLIVKDPGWEQTWTDSKHLVSVICV